MSFVDARFKNSVLRGEPGNARSLAAINDARARIKIARRLIDEPYLKEMLAAIEHGGVTHDGGRHVPSGVAQKHTLYLGPRGPILFPSSCLSSLAAASTRKVWRRGVERSLASAVARGRRRAGKGENFFSPLLSSEHNKTATTTVCVVMRCRRRRSSHLKHPRVK